MAWHNDLNNVVETFRIQTEGFDLWATLICLDERHRFMICGGTRFEKGNICCFHSEVGDRTLLRNRLLAACRPIAAFYGATLMHRKIEPTERENETGALLPAQTSQWVH